MTQMHQNSNPPLNGTHASTAPLATAETLEDDIPDYSEEDVRRLTAPIDQWPMEERLPWFLNNPNRHEWYDTPALEVFAHFYLHPVLWGRIYETFKDLGGSASRLEQAVRQHRREQGLPVDPEPSARPRRPAPPAVDASAELSHLKCTATGTLRACAWNIHEVLTLDPRWVGVFGFDEFAQAETLVRCPPYLTDTGAWLKRPLEDHDDTETAMWLQREYDLHVTPAQVAETIHALARRHPYHPIRDYLASLAWDGLPRLDTWLHTYCRAEDSAFYVAAVVKPPCVCFASLPSLGAGSHDPDWSGGFLWR